MSKTKTCTIHGKNPPLGFYFRWGKKKKDGTRSHQYSCKECQSTTARKYTESNPERRKEQKKRAGKKYNKKHKKKLAKLQRDWRRKNPGRRTATDKRHYYKARVIVLYHYCDGKEPYCACCGEKRIELLALDHKLGDGAKHRKEINRRDLYKWAMKNGFPEMFRVLCWNCNHAYAAQGNCPHQPNFKPKPELLEALDEYRNKLL